jgi:hypothetical protein
MEQIAKDIDKKAPGFLSMLIFSIGVFSVNSMPFTGTSTFLAHFGTLQAVALTASFIAVLSNMSLGFIQSVAIPVMIPFGLFLSIFSITRKMGRTLIAFGVGLYVFLPLSILISESMYNSAYKVNTDPPMIPKSPEAYNFASDLQILQAAEIEANIIGGAIMMSAATVGPAITAPACATGGVLTSATCGVFAPICAPIFAIICSFIRGLADIPPVTGLGVQIFSVSVATVKIIALQGILHASIPPEVYAEIVSPLILAIPATASLVLWPLTIIGAMTPNLMITLGTITNIVAAPISGISGFLANYYLSAPLATKLTNITLDYTPYVLQYAVPIMLIPIIVIFVLITGIRSISPMIGGEVQILGVSELI